MAPEKKKDAKKAAAKMAKAAKGEVDLILVCDESGSMGGNVEAVVTGVNEFVGQFREHKAKVTLMMFDDPGPNADERFRFHFERKAISKVKLLEAADYNPRGMTPLNDAIIEAVERAARAGAGKRTFMVILTDGLENASSATPEQVKQIVKAREKDGWAFLYLGANDPSIRANTQALGLGKAGQAFSFTSSPGGTSTALRSATHLAAGYVADQDQYAVAAASAWKASGGVIAEDEDIAKYGEPEDED